MKRNLQATLLEMADTGAAGTDRTFECVERRCAWSGLTRHRRTICESVRDAVSDVRMHAGPEYNSELSVEKAGLRRYSAITWATYTHLRMRLKARGALAEDIGEPGS